MDRNDFWFAADVGTKSTATLTWPGLLSSLHHTTLLTWPFVCLVTWQSLGSSLFVRFRKPHLICINSWATIWNWSVIRLVHSCIKLSPTTTTAEPVGVASPLLYSLLLLSSFSLVTAKCLLQWSNTFGSFKVFSNFVVTLHSHSLQSLSFSLTLLLSLPLSCPTVSTILETLCCLIL